MMRIDSVAARSDRAGRHQVVFSDGTVMRLYRQTVEDFGLYPGMELSDEDRDKLRQAAGQMSAKMRAVRIVAASSVSRSDLQQRLIRKGESPQQAQEAVRWMEELSLVDDEQTAKQLIQRCIAKGYGKARAKQVLYEKKIPKDLWESVLEDYPQLDDSIRTFLAGRLTGQCGAKEVKRAVDALLRRGHSYGQIRKVLAEFLPDIESLQEEI